MDNDKNVKYQNTIPYIKNMTNITKELTYVNVTNTYV